VGDVGAAEVGQLGDPRHRAGAHALLAGPAVGHLEIGAEMQAAHLLVRADVVGQRPRRRDRDRAVAAAEDRHLAAGQHLAHGLVDALVGEAGVDLGHLHVAAIDAAALQVDLVFEPVGEVFLRGQAELARAFLGAGLADVALVEGHADEGEARLGGFQGLGVEGHVLGAQEGDLPGRAVVFGLVAALRRKEMGIGLCWIHR
jgi:hypothetical protein